MKPLICFLLAFVALSAAPLGAKPKLNVRVKVNDYFGKQRPTGNLGMTLGNDSTFATIYYLNVTVLSDDANAVAKNNGQWCITGSMSLVVGGEYQGTLDGGAIHVDIPQKDGKSLAKVLTYSTTSGENSRNCDTGLVAITRSRTGI